MKTCKKNYLKKLAALSVAAALDSFSMAACVIHLDTRHYLQEMLLYVTSAAADNTSKKG